LVKPSYYLREALARAEAITQVHLAEALQYRPMLELMKIITSNVFLELYMSIIEEKPIWERCLLF
jgi:hypothetical protein